MKFLLDTNTVSALMRGEPHAAVRVAGTPREDIAISQVTAAEIEFGLRYLPASMRRRALEAQWSAVGAELIRLPWSDEVSRRFGERKAKLEKVGRRMSDFDLAIAVHALVFGLTLVTADRAFGRLGLSIENWLD
ncbi:MAG: PIN domain-containing protein [Deltaproteobacteria bacterium]|nr:PIN domain-containing protein [Deltaproteobacteria bacterium]